MLKYEVGRGRPTENRAINSIRNQEADEWIAKIDAAAASTDNVQAKLEAVSKVWIEMAKKVRSGEIEFLLFTTVSRRRNINAYLPYLTEKYGTIWTEGKLRK